jgi:hypothetical protein
VAESFFATLKVQMVDRYHYRTRAEARVSIFRWIAWYNQPGCTPPTTTCRPSSGNSSIVTTTH